MIKVARWLLGAWLLAAALTVPAASAVQAQEVSAAKLRDIGRIFEITGMDTMLDGMIGNIVGQQMKDLAAILPQDIPRSDIEDFQRILVEEFKASKDDLYGRAAAVYDRHFTHAEVLEMIRWYETPLGRKTIVKMPTLMNELMASGRQWGEAAGRRAGERMKSRRGKGKR